jgi:nucleotide-binding universal stress UspA family protein
MVAVAPIRLFPQFIDVTFCHSLSDPTSWGEWSLAMATAQVAATGVGIHNVLIATDFSHHCHCALKLGLDFAHLYGAQAEVVYVLPTEEYVMAGPEALLAAKDAARRDLLDLKASLRRSLAFEEGEDYHVSMLEGPVTDCLLQLARDKRTDLIVVGTHGRGGLGKIILGSVAEKLFRHSPVPVLTIGPHIRRPGDFGNARHILAPCDLAPKSHPAIRFACSLAREHNSQLTILHVIEHRSQGMKLDPDRVRQGIKEELAGIVGKCGEGVELRYRIESGNISSTILDVAAETDSDLIVLGVRPSSGFLDRFMWPIAYELVREAACPVLTIRGGVAPH